LTPKYLTLNDPEWPFTLNSLFQVQNLLIYLYGQRHDIYGEGTDDIFGERKFEQSY